MTSSIRNRFIPLVYPVHHRRRPHVLQREALELQALLLRFFCCMHHQPTQVRIESARRVGLAVAAAEYVQAGRTEIRGQV